MVDAANHEHDPLRPHRHDPNLQPPSEDASFTVSWAGQQARYTPEILAQFPAVTLDDCYIVSTGHGTSGPFSFTGVALTALIAQVTQGTSWREVAVVSEDGFGVRLYRSEVDALPATRPALLAWAIDGRPLTRREGLVRLIEPNETDDALRQVKWIARIEIV
ncbi:molybdopterin-dependent oxidoreductase [bacterium]|nr:molybdopterin-dependent oxidoreductase [bacterium]